MLMGLLRRFGWVGGLGAVTLMVSCGVVSSAQAAFPGRNGLLAVQPLKGSGVVLVKANGRGVRRVCATPVGAAAVCALARPRWSPDGRTVLASVPISRDGPSFGSSVVIYPDGSCLNCTPPVYIGGTPQLPYSLLGGVDGSFMSNPTLVTTVLRRLPGRSPLLGDLIEYGVDGVWKRVLLSSAVSDPAWSSRGELALVGQRGWILAGRPGKLRRLTRGSAPAWSPDGERMVFVRGGWLIVGRASDRSFRRLVRGTAPAWSPDGKWIAFFGKSHRLNVIPAGGGPVHHVGRVTGTTVDWQSLPARPPGTCQTPPGSTVLASSDTATLSADTQQIFGSQSAMGCLRADGRERVLVFIPAATTGLSLRQGAVAGPYAALLFDGGARYGIRFITIKLYDMRTAAELSSRAISTFCICQYPGQGQISLDEFVLGSDAVMAANITRQDSNGLSEQIQASDSTGVHTLDSVTAPNGPSQALTNLTLTGDTLTWQHSGALRSAQLQP